MSVPEFKPRSNPRSLVLVTPVKIGEEQKYFFGYAMNISRSGLMIHTLTSITIGKEISIEFTLPGSEVTVRCRSKVVWNRGISRGPAKVCRLGIMFIDLAPFVADRIDEWVASQATAEVK